MFTIPLTESSPWMALIAYVVNEQAPPTSHGCDGIRQVCRGRNADRTRMLNQARDCGPGRMARQPSERSERPAPEELIKPRTPEGFARRLKGKLSQIKQIPYTVARRYDESHLVNDREPQVLKLLSIYSPARFSGSVIAFLMALIISSAAVAEKRVAIGYQPIPGPWLVGIADGSFEKLTGYKIDWIRYPAGAESIAGFRKNQVQITHAGSAPIASAASAGARLQLFWILADLDYAEALVVRDGAGIHQLGGLRGKTIGVPFGSTAHYQVLSALRHYEIKPEETKIINLSPRGIWSAWNNATIDATFIWNPVLSSILKTGRVLVHSGQLNRWGSAAFDGLIVNPDWAHENPDFMTAFIRHIAALNTSYRESPEEWDAQSDNARNLASILGGRQVDVPASLRPYTFPRLGDQPGRSWLGGSGSIAARTLLRTAEFLAEHKFVTRSLPDYAQFITSRWVKAVLNE